MDYSSHDRDIFKIEIDEHGKSLFLEMARWTKFLAVLGFVFTALMLLVGIGLLSSNAMSAIYGDKFAGAGSAVAATMFFVYIVIGALYVYPIVCLYRYSTAIKTAMQTSNQQLFNVAVNHLKHMFKFIGILALIIIIIYGIILIFAGIGLALR